MVRNISERGVPLRSIAAAPDPAAHVARLRAAGFARAEAVDMDQARICRICRIRRINSERTDEWMGEYE